MSQPDQVLTLYFGEIPLGSISNMSPDQPWIHGDFTPFPAAGPFRPFFEACTDEDRPFPEPGGAFPDEYFDDHSWSVVDQAGQRRTICVPAVHWEDGTISWRWSARGSRKM